MVEESKETMQLRNEMKNVESKSVKFIIHITG